MERRYNDFALLSALLLAKYSNRMIPRIPPKQIMSDLFLEDRRRGLQRWLRLISHHPTVSEDRIYKSFMTDTSDDRQAALQESYDEEPDEIVNISPSMLLPPVDKGVLYVQRDRIRTMLNLVVKLKIGFQRQAKRETEQAKDFADMAHNLSSMDLKSVDDFAKSFVDVASEGEKMAKNQQEAVMERMEMVIEALSGHSDLCDRIEKKICAEPTFSHPTSMRSRLQSVVRTPSTDQVVQLEIEHERQNAFAMYCLRHETTHAERYLKLMPSILLQFSHEESKGFSNIAQIFAKIIQNESDKLN